jgi:hypothetical protein
MLCIGYGDSGETDEGLPSRATLSRLNSRKQPLIRRFAPLSPTSAFAKASADMKGEGKGSGIKGCKKSRPRFARQKSPAAAFTPLPSHRR